MKLFYKGVVKMNNNEMYIDVILPDVKASNPKQIFQKIAEHVCNMIGTPEEKLYGLLVHEDNSFNAVIDCGVAVADAKLPRLTRPMIVYAKLDNAVDFDAPDSKLVDMIAVVLSPEFEGIEHLQRLAMTTRFFSNKDARDMLHDAQGFEEVRNAVKNINARKKAA